MPLNWQAGVDCNGKKMKVLFVSSGNKTKGISPVVENQETSLIKHNICVEFFPINGRGSLGYLKNVSKLSSKIRKENYDVIHAHYSLSGFVATLATPFKNRIIASLMGTFRKGSIKYYLVRFLAKYRWKAVIVKSERMKTQIGIKNAYLIPNGVQMEKFSNLPLRDGLRKRFGFHPDRKYVIFVSNPERPEKNFALCNKAIGLLNDSRVELVPVFDKSHDEVAKYMLAADVLMLTSFTEGSPNVIKEAMVANCPIVTANVGDVEYTIGNTEGCYIFNSFEPVDAAEKLRLALAYGTRTNGRERIISLGLDDNSIAKKIISIYTK